eukprot:149320-Prorocentrum_lima.AAC.1
MTSSLVGSEMCIRDSLNTAPLRGSSAGRRITLDSHIRRKMEYQSLSLITVSYTHLTLPTICSV